MAKKILIIDDEPAVLTYLRTLLEDHGYETQCSVDAQQAFRMVEEEPPDLITLDLLMPEMTGIRLYREIKKDDRLRQIPVVMVTGFTAKQHPMIDFKKFIYDRSIPGPAALIEKPVDPDELLSAISAALEQTAARPS